MTTCPWLMSNLSGVKILRSNTCYSKLPFQNHHHDTCRFSKFYGTALALRRNASLKILYFKQWSFGTAHNSSAGTNYQLDVNDNSHTEPFLLNLIKEAIWATRSLLLFLAEQPSQLKYIEWPTFKSTVKTAILTLVIVALLIVALASVDSTLSYLLALFLRKKS